MPTYEEMGKAAMLVGMVRAREILDTEITKLQTELQEDPSKKIRRGTYWAAMTKEQRSAEVQRRMKVSVARKFRGGTFLRNGRISTRGLKRGTPAFRTADAHNKRLARATKKAEPKPRKSSAQTSWERMSVKQRKDRLAKMLAGKTAKHALVNGEAQA